MILYFIRKEVFILSGFVKKMAIKKLKQITNSELLEYAEEYNFSITNEESIKIINYIQNHEINPFETSRRIELFKELAKITNQETANKANELFIQIIKSYHLEHLFDS